MISQTVLQSFFDLTIILIIILIYMPRNADMGIASPRVISTKINF